jgi:hypothetical protein
MPSLGETRSHRARLGDLYIYHARRQGDTTYRCHRRHRRSCWPARLAPGFCYLRQTRQASMRRISKEFRNTKIFQICHLAKFGFSRNVSASTDNTDVTRGILWSLTSRPWSHKFHEAKQFFEANKFTWLGKYFPNILWNLNVYWRYHNNRSLLYIGNDKYGKSTFSFK